LTILIVYTMSQSYVKECIFCHQARIRMSDKDGNWKAYNLDGSVHDCKKNENKTSESVPNNGNDLSVEVLLKRLDQLGISIDLQKLRLVK
jgi:hypothetical protein